MNKYIYSECGQDYWPSIKTILAKSYEDGIERLADKYSKKFNDDKISNMDDIFDLQNYLNEEYSFVISDLEDIEGL